MNKTFEKLPFEKQEIVSALLEKVNTHFKEDVAAILLYGSYITGTANEKSDLDFYFIPKTEKAFDMSFQFIIEDIGYDFWPVSWERLEKFVSFEQPLVSLILDSEAIYFYSDADKIKFENLINKAKENLKDENIMKNKAENILSTIKKQYFDLEFKKEDELKICTSQILSSILNIIAYMNSSYIVKASYNLSNEIKTFNKLPENFMELFEGIINSSEKNAIIRDLRNLIKNTEYLILNETENEENEQEISNDNAKGFYEELKSTYNKIIHACETENHLKAYFAVLSLENEFYSFFGDSYLTFNFPNLIKYLETKNFKGLKGNIVLHEKCFVEILKKHDVEIIKFDNINEFKKFLL